MSGVLSHEEVVGLIALAQEGDEQAQRILVERNVALVKSIVKKFLGRGAEYDDLFQLGCLGLVKAIRNFSTDYDVRFSTYAVPMIMGEIKRFLRDDGMVKVSRSLKEVAAKAAAAAEQLGRELGREVTIAEISERTGVSPEELVMAMDASRGCISLETPLFDDDSASLSDRLVAQDSTDDKLVDEILLKELLRRLEPRERQIIMLRYFGDRTQSQIAKSMGVSQVQISRLEARILKKLRAYAKD